MRTALLASVLLLGTAAAASAETAEELVTLLVAGITDGSKLANVALKKTGDSPATYSATIKLPDGKENTLSLKTTKKTDCTYDVTLLEKAGDKEQTQTASLDFSKVKNMEYQSGKTVKVTADSYCSGNIPPACQGKLAVDVDATKYKQAYSDFRAKFCKS